MEEEKEGGGYAAGIPICAGYHWDGQFGQLLVHVKLPSESLRMETLAVLRTTTGYVTLHVSSARLLVDRVRHPQRRCASTHLFITRRA